MDRLIGMLPADNLGEGTLNEFFVISRDTVNFKQKGAKEFAKFIRKKHNY